MMNHDLSQLPVMTTGREVIGIITWTSFGNRLVLGKASTVMRDLMGQHHETRADASLLDAIGVVVQQHSVLIRGKDDRITELSEFPF